MVGKNKSEIIKRCTFLLVGKPHLRYVKPHNNRDIDQFSRSLDLGSRGCGRKFRYPDQLSGRSRMMWAWTSPHRDSLIPTGKPVGLLDNPW